MLKEARRRSRIRKNSVAESPKTSWILANPATSGTHSTGLV